MVGRRCFVPFTRAGLIELRGRLGPQGLLFFFLLFFLLFLLGIPAAHSENITTVELELFDTLQRSADGSWLHAGAGSAAIRIDQTGNRSVRSQFELSAAILPSSTGIDSLQTISRAYGKFRFESYRGVIGKAPFSWGEGLIFNAADEIFGRGTGVSLAQQEFDDPTAWITSLSRYFGPFSFAEVLINPGVAVVGATGDPAADPTDGAEAAGIEAIRAGIRLVGKPGGIKLESGYLFDGRSGTAGQTALQDGDFYHRLYMSLQGNLWLDWHLSSSLELPDPGHLADSRPDALWAGQLYTAGVYSMLPVGYDDTLSFRVEARVHPAGTWVQDHSTDTPGYGLYNYGEITYDFGRGFSLIGRGLVSPIDFSARLTPGLSWNLFQGFTLLGFATIQTGEARDTYAWEAKNSAGEYETGSAGLAIQLGCSITY